MRPTPRAVLLPSPAPQPQVFLFDTLNKVRKLTHMLEKWLKFPDYPDYEISNLGRVKSFKNHGGPGVKNSDGSKILKSSPNSKGYLVNGFVKDGRRKTRTLHTVVASLFHGPCPKGFECSHLDGNRQNCKASNLQWEPHRSNMYRQVGHETDPAGTRNGRRKLTLEQVSSVTVRRAAGESLSAIGRDYGVSPQTIFQIYHGKSWKKRV